jgi:hypothetical protein
MISVNPAMSSIDAARRRNQGLADTSFLIPADKSARYAKVLPDDPETGRPQSIQPLTQKLKFECGGGCAASTASDYMRFALMLLNKGKSGPERSQSIFNVVNQPSE